MESNKTVMHYKIQCNMWTKFYDSLEHVICGEVMMTVSSHEESKLTKKRKITTDWEECMAKEE